MRSVVKVAAWLCAASLVLWMFFAGVTNVGTTANDEGAVRLEESLRRAVVACYATEGFYPPDLAYLEENYGVQVNHDRYFVDYILVADNLMPDFTVITEGGGQ